MVEVPLGQPAQMPASVTTVTAMMNPRKTRLKR